MKPRTLLILTALTLILGGFIFFVERDLPSTDEQRELEKKLVPFEAEEITKLTLLTGEQEIRFEKTTASEADSVDELIGGLAPAAEWQLIAPSPGRADSTAVEALISRLVGLEKGREIKDFDAEELGLLEPRAQAVLETATSSRTVRIGSDLPLSSDLVMQGEDLAIAFQVGEAEGLIGEMSRPFNEWRDRRLFDAERADIRRLTLSRAGEAVELARRGEGESFWLEGEVEDRVDTQNIGGLLTSLIGLEAARFLDQSPNAMATGLEPPAQTIEVAVDGQDEPWRLELGLASGALDPTSTLRFARIEGQLIEIDASGLEAALAQEAADWRSKAWSSLQVFKVDQAYFKLGEQSFEIRRDAGDWWRKDPNGDIKVDYDVASDALYPLTEIRALELLAPSTPLPPLHLEITLQAADGAEELLRLYTQDGSADAMATVDGREAILRLAAEDAAKILEKVETLRVAEPFVEPSSEGDE